MHPQKWKNIPVNSDSTTYTTKYVPVSVSVHSNVPEFDSPRTFVSERDIQDLIDRFTSYLREIYDRSFQILKTSDTFREVYSALDMAVEQQRQKQGGFQYSAKPSSKYLLQVLTRYLQHLPCVSFNGGHYDINLYKAELFTNLTTVAEEKGTQDLEGVKNQTASRKRSSSVLKAQTLERRKVSLPTQAPESDTPSDTDDSYDDNYLIYPCQGDKPCEQPFVVKASNSFKINSTAKLRFLDVKFYLAPGYSYSSYLKAFGVEEKKAFFFFPMSISGICLNCVRHPYLPKKLSTAL